MLNITSLIESKTNDKLQQECELYQMALRIAQRYGRNLAEKKERPPSLNLGPIINGNVINKVLNQP